MKDVLLYCKGESFLENRALNYKEKGENFKNAMNISIHIYIYILISTSTKYFHVSVIGIHYLLYEYLLLKE